MFIISIAGGSGSGKTTFADKVVRQVNENIPILNMDSYYLSHQPESNRTVSGKANYDHPDAFDWDLLRYHLSSLKKNQAIDVPIYDFHTSTRTERHTRLEANRVVIFEGIFALYDQSIREMSNIKTFLKPCYN